MESWFYRFNDLRRSGREIRVPPSPSLHIHWLKAWWAQSKLQPSARQRKALSRILILTFPGSRTVMKLNLQCLATQTIAFCCSSPSSHMSLFFYLVWRPNIIFFACGYCFLSTILWKACPFLHWIVFIPLLKVICPFTWGFTSKLYILFR